MNTLTMLMLRQHFEQMGIRDHTEVAMLLYLACTSRKMREQVSIILAGLSSAGKSTILKAVLKLIPQEDRIELSFITKAALLRLNDLRGKILAINESIDDSELASPFRQLASEGEVRYQLILNGEATEFLLRGPAVVLETTTDLDGIDFQNRNRGFVVQFDPARIDLDQRAQREKRKWLVPQSDNDHFEIIKEHRAFQAALDGGLQVVIPFACEIQLKVRNLHEQRLIQNFLRIIAAIAFLQQKERNVATDSNGVQFIEATKCDYAEAYRLMRAIPLETGDDLMSEEAAKLLADIYDHKELNTSGTFTRAAISRHLSAWTPKRVRNHIKALVENDLLDCSVGMKNRKEYCLSELGREALAADQVFANALHSLTPPDKLAASPVCHSLPDQQGKF